MRDNVMAITIDRSYRDGGPAPLYHHYDREINAQPAYLELDEDGTVCVDYSGEIGNAITSDVWHGRTLRYPVNPALSQSGIDRLIDAAMPLLERVYAGHDVEWDGSNFVGRMTDDAAAASEKLERLCEEWGPDPFDIVNIQEALDWAMWSWNDVLTGYRAAEDKTAYMQQLQEMAWNEADGTLLTDMEQLERRLEEAVDETEA